WHPRPTPRRTGRRYPRRVRRPAIVLALPLLMGWFDQARGARLMGLLPTIIRMRPGESRQWIDQAGCRPIDVLPDAESATPATSLREFLGTRVVAHDRGRRWTR